MAGHKRRDHVPVCPALPSPPSSPEREQKPATHALKIPAHGYYHHTNPNWEEPRPSRSTLFAGPARDDDNASLVPTVLVDYDAPGPSHQAPSVKQNSDEAGYGHGANAGAWPRTRVPAYTGLPTRRGPWGAPASDAGSPAHSPSPPRDHEHDGGYDELDADDSISVRAALAAQPSLAAVRALMKNAPPLAGLFRTPHDRADLSRVRRGAERLGLHTGLVHKPRSARGTPSSDKSGSPMPARGSPLGEREASWWLVMGRDKDAVGHVLDLQQAHVASGLDPDAPPGILVGGSKYNVCTPRGITMMQIFCASMMGALVMVAALAMM